MKLTGWKYGCCCLLLLLGSCNRTHTATPAFYYWKTVYRPTPFEKQRLQQLGSRTMYVRLFDVDWDYANQRPVPVGVIRWGQPADTSLAYIPAVFITQRTLTHIPAGAIPAMAANLATLVREACGQAGINPKEIQVDCDWNSKTKGKYFALLKALKQQDYCNKRQLSCTIRMHQAKYTIANGIPPADRGMLMCYNMGDLKKYGDKNSILDVGEARDYLAHLDTYPLPLDVALPLFSWCLQFRNRQFVGILRDVSPAEVRGSSLFRPTGRLYQCLKDTLWHGFVFRMGDEVRIEEPATEEIAAIGSYALKHIVNNQVTIAFFHCDSIILNKYSGRELEKIYAACR